MAIERITKFSDTIQPTDIINEVVDVVNNADLEEFVGASESQAGKKGIVPAPEAGSEDRYLNADGTWKEVKQNLTVYTSLEQIGITPGEETFASIHNALPINSVLEYYRSSSSTFADIYPEDSNYGYVRITKLNANITKFEYVKYIALNINSLDNSTNDNIGIYYSTYYNSGSPNRLCTWNRAISDKDSVAQSLIASLSLRDYNENNFIVEKLRLMSSLMDGTDTNINKYQDIVFRRDDNFRLGGIRSKMANVSAGDSTELRSTLALYTNKSEAEGNGAQEGINISWSPYYGKVVNTFNGLVRVLDHIQLAGSDDGQLGFQRITSSTDITNCPLGNYFFYGNTPVDDSDSIVKGWDIQGISLRGRAQATQLLFNGGAFYYRYDDNITNGAQPTYSSWVQMINSNGGTITGNLTVNGTITGTKVVGAVYNDYAEFFPRGEETEAGDIIMLDPNSEEEKYIKASTSIITEHPLVVGVHSEEYSHLIGGELPENGEDFYDYNIDKYIPVGLAGRCKVKIKGKAIKGAPVTISDTSGVGVCTNNININSIVGYLVESDNIEDENNVRLLKVKLK